MKQTAVTILIIGIPFCLIGAFMAGAIVYEEYKHHFNEKRKALRPAAETAIIVFFVFLVLTIGAMLLLNRTF